MSAFTEIIHLLKKLKLNPIILKMLPLSQRIHEVPELASWCGMITSGVKPSKKNLFRGDLEVLVVGVVVLEVQKAWDFRRYEDLDRLIRLR
ncbi:hypothetical protein MKW98_019900, partial [Papaver atlanticum]